MCYYFYTGIKIGENIMKRFILPLNDGIHLKVKINSAEQQITMQVYIVQAILEKLHQDELKKEKK